MSIQAQSYVWHHSKAEGSALLLLLYIANCAHDDGTGAWPSVDRMAKYCRQSERNVQYLLRKLEKIGELVTAIGEGPHGCNAYTIPMPSEKIAPGVQTNAHRGANQRHRGVQTSVKSTRQIAPEPSLTVQEEPSGISKENDSQEFAAMFTSVENAMGGELSPGECEIVKELWEEKPDFQAHHYAYVQTRDHAGGFNLKYYEKCLRGFNGSKRQLQILNAATFSDTS